VKNLLSRVPLYVGLQRLVGADRLRYRCLDELALQPDCTVLDVGCGPAYYLDRLPRPHTYVGFDTEPRYIDWARKHWQDGATFHLGTFDDEWASRLPPVDAVLLLGVLHHLSDSESSSLLALTARALAPGGRVVAVDTCFDPSQGRIARWMADHDRGEHVREPAAFTTLADEWFERVEGELWTDVTRVPGTYWMMRLRDPRPEACPASPGQNDAGAESS
jgi:SAM-dependent methyltransferase